MYTNTIYQGDKHAKHPAKFTDTILQLLADILNRYAIRFFLDPFAGVCKVHEVRRYGWAGYIHCGEMEPEWAVQGLGKVTITVGDSQHLPYLDGMVPCIVTSITYGNRMADKHKARDKSKRNTYTHTIGRQLTPGNTGAMNWGNDYRAKHVACYMEFVRVLADGKLLILNVSDHIREGRRVRVTLWHILTLKRLGFEVLEHHRVPTPRNRQGANGDKRVPYESVIAFRLHK